MDIIDRFFPDLLLSHFDIVNHVELCDISTRDHFFEISMDEINKLPSGYNAIDYKSKGFYSRVRIQDFPIRGKAVFLMIKRRRWRDKITKKQIISDYSFISEGARLTQELSDFLKGPDRFQRRYNQ